MPTELSTTYRPLDGSYDEMVGGDGRVRQHWSAVSRALDELGLDELGRRQREATRLLDDDGVTYHVYGGRAGRAQRWRLDPVPVLLSSDEWADIEQGVIQRAELLNLVLTDLYTSRDLIRRRLLPPELVHAHPGFLRPCDGVTIPGAQLFTCAVDLARDGEGRCWVLADRTQAPSGAGYALENRTVVSRVFPSLYRDAQVHRLAPFVRTLRSALQAAAPPTASDPRIVVLTPGSLSETAFEHAYLASHLGYPLVEGADLTVRDGRVWLRSLGRPEPVDVILRRVDSEWCDPLELRPDSHLGVPGLVEATRLGKVAVVNTLGSGVLENPGLLPFLPKLSEALLGQPLRLPSAPTWWCGEDTSRSHVLSRLESLIIKPIGRTGSGPQALLGWELGAAARDDLRARIEARPHLWCGQEPLALACAPTLTDRGLESRRTVMRTFLVARGESYAAMPGGLTRVAGSTRPGRISNQAGALSKDTWVLASEPEALTSFWLQAGPAVVAVDPNASMSARAAENLFWLSRYAERAESVVRLVRVVNDRRNEFQHGPNPAGQECLRSLLAALTDVTATWPGFSGPGAEERLAAPGGELVSLLRDDSRAGSLAYDVRRMLDAAHAVRDQLSVDTWLVMSTLERELLDIDRDHPERQALVQSTISRVMQSLLALAGLAAESLVRDPGWRFLDAGRRIERALQLARLLRSTLAQERTQAADSLLLESLLSAAESIITYRRRYRSQAQVETVLDLLLLDPENPRSLVYQVDRLAEDVAQLPGADALPAGRLTAAGRAVLETSTTLRLADTALLARTSDEGRRMELELFLARIHDLLTAAADAIHDDHFITLLPQQTVLAPASGTA